jgi:hypothetical protein
MQDCFARKMADSAMIDVAVLANERTLLCWFSPPPHSGNPRRAMPKKVLKLAGKEPEALHRSYAAHFPAAQAIQAQTT